VGVGEGRREADAALTDEAERNRQAAPQAARVVRAAGVTLGDGRIGDAGVRVDQVAVVGRAQDPGEQVEALGAVVVEVLAGVGVGIVAEGAGSPTAHREAETAKAHRG